MAVILPGPVERQPFLAAPPHPQKMKQAAAVFTLLTMGFLSSLFGDNDHEQRKAKIEVHEAATPSAEALERRARSIDFLKQKGIPTIAHLPVIEDSRSAKIRSPKEISERLVACTICAVGGETGDRALLGQIREAFSAESLLSPKEREFVEGKIEDQQTRVQFSWRYERSWVLLWALGYVDRLEYPPSICEVPKLVGMLRGKSVEQIAKEAKPRSRSEILDEADLIYRLHWAVVEARVNKTVTLPKEIEKGVVLERHSALNWLIGYMGQEWDDISTDT